MASEECAGGCRLAEVDRELRLLTEHCRADEEAADRAGGQRPVEEGALARREFQRTIGAFSSKAAAQLAAVRPPDSHSLSSVLMARQEYYRGLHAPSERWPVRARSRPELRGLMGSSKRWLSTSATTQSPQRPLRSSSARSPTAPHCIWLRSSATGFGGRDHTGC